MKLPNPTWLGLLYAFSELYLGLTHRARGGLSREKKSLRILWMIILASVFFGVKSPLGSPLPSCRIDTRCALSDFSFSFLRLHSAGIRSVISENFYRRCRDPLRTSRHRNRPLPIYPPSILHRRVARFPRARPFIGNWCSLAIFTIPTTIAFLLRINVEEQALAEALGEQYRSYQQRTKRLIPFIY